MSSVTKEERKPSAEIAKRQTTIGKSVEILHILAEGETRFSNIQRALGYGNGTTHRLLKSLLDAGLIVQDPVSKDYLLSNEILKLAAKIEDGFAHISLIATREMERLREESGETVCLCKRVGLRKIIAEELASQHGIKFEYGKGYSSSFHSGATGVALLSLLDEAAVEKLLDKAELVQETPDTVIDRSRILARVAEARRNGYAVSYGEVTPGTASLSVPLQDGTSSFALTVVGPANRFFPKSMLEATLAAARRIEGAINAQRH
ncbi:transcriptional regulator, IclR family [Tistlia consotensis]|uniref:Transcriptional regulator, IclR family n=1 Tax=Tistlia consotensis USBA 355 TaxID=560819 RepID=A0A1Y6BZS8_9PROT|nr:IclR family transcriptional regulator [Tistlia consotensis]SMF36808.1 transcriptional regulator, IclR family [Tistlia consotensis USBA 355]SNR72127.1 transcriptional regulator, IclR family [Tistlia consotensis]